MNPVLTLAEIRERFQSEWVLVIDPELTPELELIRGEVAWHSKDRDEVYRKARELAPAHSAFLFTGRPPENIEFILNSHPLAPFVGMHKDDPLVDDWKEGPPYFCQVSAGGASADG